MFFRSTIDSPSNNTNNKHPGLLDAIKHNYAKQAGKSVDFSRALLVAHGQSNDQQAVSIYNNIKEGLKSIGHTDESALWALEFIDWVNKQGGPVSIK